MFITLVLMDDLLLTYVNHISMHNIIINVINQFNMQELNPGLDNSIN